ncbi:GSU0071 family protein [Geotalea sp. SG265]|uniref:GSU0071 family protein n=1 Tax=Geotalea sp. SG265 TaxID=2922867 RepID=UPI001FAF5A66|nr:hypothetical protein [Geotalea sp. SG265]
MNTEIIDEAIDKYVHERMTTGRKQATERFLSYAYLKQGKEGIGEFLRKVRGLSNYYIDFLRVMANPLKGPEVAWLASMLTIAIYAVILMGMDEDRTLGIFLFAGTLVNGWSLIRTIARKWCDIGVMIAIYLEIAQLAEHELEEMS